jgi:hypothetical protein
MILLCSPGWPQTWNLPASASWELGLVMNHHGQFFFFLFFWDRISLYTQTSFKLTTQLRLALNLWSSCLSLPSARIIDVYHMLNFPPCFYLNFSPVVSVVEKEGIGVYTCNHGFFCFFLEFYQFLLHLFCSSVCVAYTFRTDIYSWWTDPFVIACFSLSLVTSLLWSVRYMSWV